MRKPWGGEAIFSVYALSNTLARIADVSLTVFTTDVVGPQMVDHLNQTKLKGLYLGNKGADLLYTLPSLSEPWGLVVEKAVYYELPVLASSKVGSVEDLVLNYGASTAFNPLSESSLQNAIKSVAFNYEKFAKATLVINFDIRDTNQIRVYIEAVNGGMAL